MLRCQQQTLVAHALFGAALELSSFGDGRVILSGRPKPVGCGAPAMNRTIRRFHPSRTVKGTGGSFGLSCFERGSNRQHQQNEHVTCPRRARILNLSAHHANADHRHTSNQHTMAPRNKGLCATQQAAKPTRGEPEPAAHTPTGCECRARTCSVPRTHAPPLFPAL